MSPLEQAVMQNDLDQVKQILTITPSSISEPAEEGIPLLLLAAQYGSSELLRYLTEYSRASLDETDSMHRNILHYATASGDVQKCRYLIERGGMSVLQADHALITPYQMAYELYPDTLYPYYRSIVTTPYPAMYHNPIRRGFFPDPSIVRVENDYYMVNSSFIFFPCIPVSHSTDLVHWTIIGHAIINPEWSELSELEGGRGYWAPDISYDQGRFYITATYRYNDTGTVYRRQMVVSSDRPEGPYSRPSFIDEDGIDPSIFHENGRHYMLLNRGARIFELNEDCTEKISDAVLLYYGSQKHAPEGPHLLKKDGYYYLFQAEGGTGMNHRITVARSRERTGVYEPCPYNPIMRQNDPEAGIQRCGHGKPVMTPDGRWYMVYLCGRCLNGSFSMLGRETSLDEITWTPDGWPVVNALRGPSALAPKPFPDMDESRDDAAASDAEETVFQSRCWPSGWMTPREPEPSGVTPTSSGIILRSSPFPLSSVNSRNLFLHRQEAFRFEAEITLQLPGLLSGQEAGMVSYYDENTYVFFGISMKEDGCYCSLTERIGTETIVHEPYRLPEQNYVYRFRTETDGLKRRFVLFSETGTLLREQILDNVYYLCDEGIAMGKRFTGAVFGAAAYGTTPFFYTLRSAVIRNL